MIRFEAFSRGGYNYLSPRSKKVVASQGVKPSDPDVKARPADWATKLLDKHDIKGPRVLPRKLKESEDDIVKKIGAPSHASHGGWAERIDHAGAHKKLTGAGFVKQSGARKTVSHKMGRSAAHSSTKEQKASYSHPHGHTADITTRTAKYGDKEPMTYFDVKKK